MRRRKSSQSSIVDYFEVQWAGGPEEEAARQFIFRLQQQANFESARYFKTTKLSAEEPVDRSLQTWHKPPVSWCSFS